mgnify:CR=1 FL=1
MKKLLCMFVAASFVLGVCGISLAGDNQKNSGEKKEGDKPAVKKEAGEKAKADKPKADKPKRQRVKKTPEDRFNALDTNQNKEVCVKEFVGKREGEQKQKAEALFSKLDKDSSGALTLAELNPPKKEKGEKKPKQDKKPAEKKQAEKKPAEKKPE